MKYQGPYEILEVLPYHTYRVRFNNKESIQHEERIKLFVEDKTKNWTPITEDNTDSQNDHNQTGLSVEEMVTKQVKWQPNTHKLTEDNRSQIWVTPKTRSPTMTNTEKKKSQSVISNQTMPTKSTTKEQAKKGGEGEDEMEMEVQEVENFTSQPHTPRRLDIKLEPEEGIVVDTEGITRESEQHRSITSDKGIGQTLTWTTPIQPNSTVKKKSIIRVEKSADGVHNNSTRKSERIRGAPARYMDYSVSLH